MGGNVQTIIKSTSEITRAQKIPIGKISRKIFKEKITKIFKALNKQFKSKYNKVIWKNESILESGIAFNGSTSFVMNPLISDEDIIQYKPIIGDVDITLPVELKEDFWIFLNDLEGKEIIPNVKYMGSNKPSISSIGEQINSIFCIEFDSIKINCQVDFEFLEYKNSEPTEWSKFSHSSHLNDIKAGIKSVHHKFLIQSLIGAASVRNDIVIVTPKSTPEKIKFKKMNSAPRMLKFSIVRGIRIAYEPLIDSETKEIIQYENKPIYKEILSKNASYITDVNKIYQLTFKESNKEDVVLFESFIGILELIKKYFNQDQIDSTHKRYVEKLWNYQGDIAQELEAQNPDLDFKVKISGYQKFIKELNLKDLSKKYIDLYYKGFGRRKIKELI